MRSPFVIARAEKSQTASPLFMRWVWLGLPRLEHFEWLVCFPGAEADGIIVKGGLGFD